MARRRSSSSMPPALRRVVAGLFGILLLALAFLMESKASILVGVIGVVIVLSVLPYRATSMRRGRRDK